MWRPCHRPCNEKTFRQKTTITISKSSRWCRSDNIVFLTIDRPFSVHRQIRTARRWLEKRIFPGRRRGRNFFIGPNVPAPDICSDTTTHVPGRPTTRIYCFLYSILHIYIYVSEYKHFYAFSRRGRTIKFYRLAGGHIMSTTSVLRSRRTKTGVCFVKTNWKRSTWRRKETHAQHIGVVCMYIFLFFDPRENWIRTIAVFGWRQCESICPYYRRTGHACVFI